MLLWCKKTRPVFATFATTTKSRRDGKTQAAFKRVQLIKNRTDTNTHGCTCTHVYTHIHACTARHPPSQHAVYEWSSNGQVVIRCNKGTTSAYLACSVVLCVSVRVCVCVSFLSIYLVHLYTDVLTGPSITLKRLPKKPQLRDA